MKKKFLFFLITFLIITISLTPFYIKVNVECKSQFGDCPAEIVTKLKMLNSKSLFKVRNESGKILKTNFLVSEYSTQFKLPNIMLVNIISKKPIFALKNSSNGQFELIDNKGTVLVFADNSGLPTVSKSELNYKIGDTISGDDLFALNLISGVYQMYQIGYGTITNDALVVDMGTGVRVIFPLRENESEVLLGALRLIYTKVINNYLGVYSQIDMRYKNPVLR